MILVRQRMEEYLKSFHLTFDRQTILEMKDIPEGIKCLIISQYNSTIHQGSLPLLHARSISITLVIICWYRPIFIAGTLCLLTGTYVKEGIVMYFYVQ